MPNFACQALQGHALRAPQSCAPRAKPRMGRGHGLPGLQLGCLQWVGRGATDGVRAPGVVHDGADVGPPGGVAAQQAAQEVQAGRAGVGRVVLGRQDAREDLLQPHDAVGALVAAPPEREGACGPEWTMSRELHSMRFSGQLRMQSLVGTACYVPSC